MDNEDKMIIEKVTKCGTGVEIQVKGVNCWFPLEATKEQIIAEIEKQDTFDTVKYEELKSLEGRDI